MKRLIFPTMVFLVLTSTAVLYADRTGRSVEFSPSPFYLRLLHDHEMSRTEHSTPNGYVTERLAGVSPCREAGLMTCDAIGGCEPRKKSRIHFYGWLEAGVYVNAHGNGSRHIYDLDRRGSRERFQVPGSGNSSLLGNVASTDPELNQFWIGVKRELDTRGGFDWGFQADFLAGTDGWMAQSYGDASFDYRAHSKDYYLAAPSLFASFGYKKWSVKIGKFETLLGYEKIQAPLSGFYSHSNLFYLEAQTHTGVLAEYRHSPNLWFNAGYVQGFDNGFKNDFDDHGFLGGVYWRPACPMTLWYTLYVGDHNRGRYENREIHPGGTMFLHTFVFQYELNDRWNYTLQWNLGDRDGNRRHQGATYYGTAHYLTCKINRRWKLGLRAEQVHANQAMDTSGFSRPGTARFIGDLYSLTFGADWTPNGHLSIRPELRYDYAEDCRPFDNGRARGQFSAGCGVVYKL